MSESVYAITDLEGYATKMRTLAAENISPDNNDNLDDYISIKEIISLVKEKCLGFDDNNRPLLDETSNEKIFEDVSVWIHSMGLVKLASKDLIDCAWDDTTNQMIFWPKTQEQILNDTKPRRKNSKN